MQVVAESTELRVGPGKSEAGRWSLPVSSLDLLKPSPYFYG